MGLLAIDQKSQIHVFNQVLSRLTGFRADKILGRPLQEVTGNSNPNHNKLQKTLNTGREFYDLKPELVIPVINSNSYTVNTYVIRDSCGIITGAMAVFTPVGQQQELKNAVIKAEKLAILGQLAAGAVHEIKNPLTTINGFLQLLQKDLKGTPKEEYLRIMLDELKHINRLITEFLQLAKPGYSKRTGCNINQLVKEIFMLVKSEALIYNIDINLQTDDDIPNIYADGEQLKQVILNIIKNAFDALSPGEKIFIQTSWSKHEGIINILIRDTGSGMDRETISSMFDPFFTTKESGTGLGMFISKKIIDNHGGRIEVKSEKGHGTTVTVLLPVN